MAGLFSVRSLLLTIILLFVTFTLFSTKTRTSKWALADPNHHQPVPHEDPLPPEPAKNPAPAGVFESAEHAAHLDETIQSDLPHDEDEVSPAGDEERPLFELGRIPNPAAEAKSNGDDWLEAYQEGVDAATYKKLPPEEDGDKIFHKPYGKGADKTKVPTPVDDAELRADDKPAVEPPAESSAFKEEGKSDEPEGGPPRVIEGPADGKAYGEPQANVESKVPQHSVAPPSSWNGTIDFPVVGLIFYGRREYISIQNCYLQQNLKKNGGVLDEIIWVLRTENQNDIAYLNELIAANAEYRIWQGADGRNKQYSDAWNVCERGKMYIKIDDDVVFFEPHTIESIVRRKMEHPEYLLVSANAINQPALAWVHYHLGAVRSYLPELSPPENFERANDVRWPAEAAYHWQTKPSWRASELPKWSGPSNYTLDEHTPSPFRGHRWLPSDRDITNTPVAVAEYHEAGSGYHSWAIGAQTHYSFLDNLEKQELWRYKFPMWDYQYDRLSINFIAIWGDDIVDNMPIDESDERMLTKVLPRRLGRHAVMEGSGLAVHFGFGKQIKGHGGERGEAMHDCDALDRYRAYAEENICYKS